MTRQPCTVSPDTAVTRERRRQTLAPAFLIGLPLSGAVLGVVWSGVLKGTLVGLYLQRYLVGHPVEIAEVVLFCCALGALLAKLGANFREAAVCRRPLLTAWDGQPVPAGTAGELLSELDQLPRSQRQSLLGSRCGNILDFVRRRDSAADLDDQARALADNDAMAQENSYGLIRFIAWAIPILGFLGTVLGITEAVAGVTPEKLESSLNQVTDGLALAFDTTALALALTMVVMFLSYLTERGEQSVLDQVDQVVDRELAHRFERGGAEQNEAVELVRQNSEQLIRATERLVERQASIWAQALQEADRLRSEAEARQQQRLVSVLESVLEKTVETHARRLATLEKQSTEQSGHLLDKLASLAVVVRDSNREQQAALSQLAQGLAGQADALTRLQEGEKQLLRLQDALNQNLSTLAGAGAFDQAVESLSAAIHLLTARVGQGVAGPRLVPKPGAAA
jgi:biopolymer transport protein ExbB/TolQ